MTDDELIGRIRQILAESHFVGEGRTSSLDPKTAGGEPDHTPKSSGRPTSGEVRNHFIAAAERAQQTLNCAKKAQPRPDTSVEANRLRILKTYEGERDEDACLKENCSKSWIRKVRTEAGMDPLYGRIK